MPRSNPVNGSVPPDEFAAGGEDPPAGPPADEPAPSAEHNWGL